MNIDFFFQTNIEDESTATDMATTPIHLDFQLDGMSQQRPCPARERLDVERE